VSEGLRVGIDVGGTFTDVIAVDPASGGMATTKTLTTPDDPSRAMLDGLRHVLAELGRSADGIEALVHGTTLVTNAVIARAGAPSALVTTSGFRDILEMGPEIRYDTYDLFLDKPEPLIPRNLRLEVDGRLMADGTERAAIDLTQVRRIGEELSAAGVRSVAVSLLHSYANPAHERAVAECLSDAHPDLDITLSSSIAPVMGEYERTSTAVANAYVQPLVKEYLGRLGTLLRREGMTATPRIMLSNGGNAALEVARDMPIQMIESGPAAGAIAAGYLARQAGADRVVSFDMGGTTAKICLIDDGEPTETNRFEAARLDRFKRGSGYPLRVPVIEMIEIGAGGGSIAQVDHLGLLKVGPRSAGAVPGAACYGLGGERPTVTDADVALGYIDPGALLGGALPLDAALAERAIAEHVAGPLGVDVQDAAIGIYTVVTNSMAVALRTHAAERGRNFRAYDLMAFGGAGPVHAYGLARSLGIGRLVCPRVSSVLSSFGMVVAPVMIEAVRGHLEDVEEVDRDSVESLFAAMRGEVGEHLVRSSVSPDEVDEVRIAELRYVGQGYELNVRLPPGPLPTGQELAELFHAAYRGRFNVELPGAAVEVVNWRLQLRGPAPTLRDASAPTGGRAEPLGRRSAYLPDEGAFVDCEVYARETLPVGCVLDGPAILQEPESTILVGTDATATIDDAGSVILTLPGKAAR
jgi:N-methylhydantoinase A